VVVGAVVTVRALLAEIMYVTHFHLLDAVHLCLVVVAAWRIDSLTLSITCNDLLAVRRLIRRRGINFDGRWSSSLSSP
jgi:hypothetical protein